MFSGHDYSEVRHALLRALLLYRDKASWQQMQETAMAQDFSWTASARQYLDLYARVLAL
jgi:starch synthase